MKIGIIGTGMLGEAVALNLLNLGFDVSVYNRTKEKAAEVEKNGATVMDSPKAVADNSELIIIIVKDASAVKEVSFGKNGIIESKNKKLIVADMSTIEPSESREIADKFEQKQIQKLEIPVMGGPNVAITGKLVMMASGPKNSFEQCKTIFEKIANKVFFLGTQGTANSIKLAMNLQITMLADMSTIEPSESREIADKFEQKQIQKLEIPVMGGPNVAITGKLVMMASGPKNSFEQCKTIFEKIANKVFFLGTQGTANSIKLAMNLQITMLALSLSEGITLVEKSEVDPKIFLEVLNSTYFKTGMSENKAFKMIDGDYDATFTLSNLKKDISTMISTSKKLGIELPMIMKAEKIYENAIKEGLGNNDYTGIIEYIKKINKA